MNSYFSKTVSTPPREIRCIGVCARRLKAKKRKKMEKSDETPRFTRKVVTITQRARYRQRADKVECHDRWE